MHSAGRLRAYNKHKIPRSYTPKLIRSVMIL